MFNFVHVLMIKRIKPGNLMSIQFMIEIYIVNYKEDENLVKVPLL